MQPLPKVEMACYSKIVALVFYEQGMSSMTKKTGFVVALFASIQVFAAGEPNVGKAVSVSGKVLLRYEGGSSLQTGFLKPGDSIVKGAIINTGSTGAVKILMTDRTIVDLGPSSLFKVNEYQLKNGNDRNVDLSLDYGTARSSVNQPITSDKGKFTIRTKAATMGVRGTEFIINAPISESLKTTASASLRPEEKRSIAAASDPNSPPGSTTNGAGAAGGDSANQTQITVVHGRVEVQGTSDTGKPGKTFEVNSGMQFSSQTNLEPPKVVQLPAQEVLKIKTEAYQKDMTFLQAVSVDPVGGEDKANKQQAQRGDNPPAEKGAPPKEGAKQTFQTIANTIETQSQQAPPPAMTELRLPGMFNQNGQVQRPIDYQNGVPIHLTVNITI